MLLTINDFFNFHVVSQSGARSKLVGCSKTKQVVVVVVVVLPLLLAARGRASALLRLSLVLQYAPAVPPLPSPDIEL